MQSRDRQQPDRWHNSLGLAPATQAPLALRRMCAAKMAPVPSALVSSSACPGRRPPFRRSSASRAMPAASSSRSATGVCQARTRPLGQGLLCMGDGCVRRRRADAPVTAKPRAASAPSQEWPPTSAHRAADSTLAAPAIIWNSSSSVCAKCQAALHFDTIECTAMMSTEVGAERQAGGARHALQQLPLHLQDSYLKRSSREPLGGHAMQLMML